MEQIFFERLQGEERLRPAWKRCIGAGNLSLALRAEYQEALAVVQREIGFEYIRCHGILSDGMALYQERPDGRAVYNFTYLDQAYDLFARLGIRPIVELSFMPQALASGLQTVFHWRGNISLPKDWTRWNDLIRTLVCHLVERYGLEEVRHWPFEIWNEPNFEEFWPKPNLQEYWKLYLETARTIKAVDSLLVVGGPAADTNGDEYLRQFLTLCRTENAPLDFISRHAYLSTQPRSTPEFDEQDILPPPFLLDKFQNARALADTLGYAQLPLYITEYNTSYTPRNPIHDTVENALLLAPVLSRCGESADLLAYWTFCDVFEELGVPNCPFHGGFGLLGRDLIPKPTYQLFRFFAQLYDQVLDRRDGLLVTAQGECAALLLWNDRDTSAVYELTLPAGGLLFCTQETVGESAANPRRVWAQLGYPRYPSHAETRRLRQTAVPRLTTWQQTAAQGKTLLTLTVEPHSFSLVTAKPVTSHLHEYETLEEETRHW